MATQSELDRNTILEILENRQTNLNGIEENYNDLVNEIELKIDDYEVELIEEGRSELTDSKREELYNTYSESLGLTALRDDRNIIHAKMDSIEEEHFQQIVNLNNYVDEFLGNDNYSSYEITGLNDNNPRVYVNTNDNTRNVELSIPGEENSLNQDDISSEQVTTIVQAEFDSNKTIFDEMPADIIFIDRMNNNQYTLSFNKAFDDEDNLSGYTFWLNEDDDEPYFLEDIFDEETKTQIENAIENQETIKIENPTNWFDFESTDTFFEYMKSEELDSPLENNTYLFRENNHLSINGWNFAEINRNDEIEISPYDYVSEDPQSIVRDKIYEMNAAYTNIHLNDLGLDRIHSNPNHVITLDNDINANDKVTSLMLSTSTPSIDRALIDGTYNQYASFSNYYNEKVSIENNDIIKNQLKEKSNTIEELKDNIEQIVQNVDEVRTDVNIVYDNTLNQIDTINLNVPVSVVPTSIREEVDKAFNDYKYFAKEEFTTIFNDLNKYENENVYIQSQSLKKLDETFIDTLQGNKSQDYYQGMKEFAKVNDPNLFSNNRMEKREQTLENINTFKTYLEKNSSLDTTIDLDKDTINTKNNEVTLSFKEIENDPTESLNTFSSHSKEKNMTIDLDI